MTLLLFKAPPAAANTGGTTLVFGQQEYVAPPASFDVRHAATFAAPTLAASVTVTPAPVLLNVGVLFAPPTLAATIKYDNRVTRYLGHAAAAPHQSAVALRQQLQGRFGSSAARRVTAQLAFCPASPLARPVASAWRSGVQVVTAHDLPFGLGSLLALPATAVLQVAVPLRIRPSLIWQTGIQHSTAAGVVFETGARRRARLLSPWQLATVRSVAARSLFLSRSSGSGHLSQLAIWTLLPHQVAKRPPPGRGLWPPLAVITPPGYAPTTTLVFQCPAVNVYGAHVLTFGPHPCVLTAVLPVDSGTFYILPARFYMTTHNLVAHRLPDMVPVPLYDATLSADVGSFAWQFSASGPDSLLDQLAPLSSGSTAIPQQLQITLNGSGWVFVVESLRRTHTFGKRTVSISGRSPTALVGSPFSRELAYTNSVATNAEQLAAQALDLTGVNLDWGITDWLVPANAWSTTGTPLAVVQAIAQAAGGYLQSHRSAATLQVRHPYPPRPDGSSGGPWNWATGNADVVLAPSAIITNAIDRRDGPDINAIYVSGTTQGVLAWVKRAGTAGDKLAPLETDALITGASAAQQRGLATLGKSGPQYAVSLELPILSSVGQPGVIDVGSLVQVNESTPWRGRVRSVSVTAAMPSARQTITLERHL